MPTGLDKAFVIASSLSAQTTQKSLLELEYGTYFEGTGGSLFTSADQTKFNVSTNIGLLLIGYFNTSYNIEQEAQNWGAPTFKQDMLNNFNVLSSGSDWSSDEFVYAVTSVADKYKVLIKHIYTGTSPSNTYYIESWTTYIIDKSTMLIDTRSSELYEGVRLRHTSFGELLDEKTPILLAFYQQEDNGLFEMDSTLKSVAAALGDKGKVIKIDIDKNQKLSEALRVKVLPTFMIYKLSEMVWRQSGIQDANTLISLLQDHVIS